MYDIQTEAYLRRTNPRDGRDSASPILPVTIAVNLILWATVLIAAL